MNRNIPRLALAVLSVTALPTVAQAGSSNKTGTASFTVMEQCSVTGSTVVLGAFIVGQTWRQVSAETGRRGLEGAIGTRGTEYLNWGSITCDKDVSYTVEIKGTYVGPASPGGVRFTIGGRTVVFQPFVKRIGDNIIPDNNWGIGGYGAYSGSRNVSYPSSLGTGAPQAILGNVAFFAGASGGAAVLDAKLTTVGSFTDKLSYNLYF